MRSSKISHFNVQPSLVHVQIDVSFSLGSNRSSARSDGNQIGMYHRMYLRRCSMSSISEESETGDDEHLDEEFLICPDTNSQQDERNSSPSSVAVESCLGDLNSFKEEIRDAYEELSTLERQARSKTISTTTTTASPATRFNIEQDDLDILLEQLQTLEQRLDQSRMFRDVSTSRQPKAMSPTITAQFDELDQALATLNSTLNNVEIELGDSGNSSSSSGMSDSTTIIHQHHRQEDHDNHQHEVEVDEQFSDSGLSQSTDSISLPFKQSTQLRTYSQLSNTSSVLTCDTLKKVPQEKQIRLALEKMHEANIRKLFVKVHNDDQSTKNILIDETMSVSDVIVLLLHKYHLQPTYNYTLVEDLPDLHIYRVFEDHQNLIHDAISHWPRDTKNRICFQEHSAHYSIFNQPKQFFSNLEKTNEKLSNDILPDYISSETIALPDNITGLLYIKDKTRKIWKKHSCVLRQSGIYQIPKPSSTTKRDLICLLKFDVNMQVYHAKNWMESLRSPTSFGFALKYAHIQKKSNKYIHYICASTSDECQRWINGIRVIQYGVQLHKNYQRMKTIVERGAENLAKVLPNQHHFNFIQSNLSPCTSQSNSTISLPINHIISDAPSLTSKSFVDLDSTLTPPAFHSLDRQKPLKSKFTRSSSFHASLRRSTKADQKLQRTCSTSPPDLSPVKHFDSNLKRSKSSREILLKSTSSKDQGETSKFSSSTSSIIPFIHQCIQAERTPSRSKPPLLPPKRPPPPIPKKLSSPQKTTTATTMMIDNHIYDSFHDSPPSTNASRQVQLDHQKTSEPNRTVSTTPRVLSMRVTEL